MTWGEAPESVFVDVWLPWVETDASGGSKLGNSSAPTTERVLFYLLGHHLHGSHRHFKFPKINSLWPLPSFLPGTCALCRIAVGDGPCTSTSADFSKGVLWISIVPTKPFTHTFSPYICPLWRNIGVCWVNKWMMEQIPTWAKQARQTVVKSGSVS